MKKYQAILALAYGVFAANTWAIEEVIVTGYPMAPPSMDIPSLGQSSGYTGFVSGGFMGGYKDTAIAAAKKQCETQFVAAQKAACDKKKETFF